MPFKVYNIGNNAPVKLTEFIDAIENSLGIIAKKNFLPMQKGDVFATHSNSKNLYNDLKFKPTMSIQEGIDHFINWYKEFYIKIN